MATLILIDNFDSFTYNLVDDLRRMGHQVEIYRNTTSIERIETRLNHYHDSILLISPGPGYPKDAGMILPLIQKIKGKHPIIGICLGHQTIIEAYGGKIIPTGDYIHGEASFIEHDEKAMFASVQNPLLVARYHSLVGDTIPDELVVNAHYKGYAMAVRDDEHYVAGFQFHPESILTTYGYQLLENTINWAIKKSPKEN